MRKPPLVSVVVPSYNHARYLPVTLDHVLHQDHPEIEVIVSDDASTDGTPEVLNEYLRSVGEEEVSYASRWVRGEDRSGVERAVHKRFPPNRRIRVLTSDRNLGATPNYIKAFREVTGEYCTFLPSDDIPHPAMISTLVGTLERTGADFAYADVHVVDDTGRILRAFPLPDYSFERCFGDWYLLGMCKLWRSSLLRTVGTFDPAYQVSRDHELFLRYALAGAKFVHVPKVLYSIRNHGPDRQVGQHSPASDRRMIEESIGLVKRAREFLARQAGKA